jgi:hypothetical protein
VPFFHARPFIFQYRYWIYFSAVFLVGNVAKTIFGGKKFFYIVPEKIVIGDAVWLLTRIDVDKCLNYQQSVTENTGHLKL